MGALSLFSISVLFIWRENVISVEWWAHPLRWLTNLITGDLTDILIDVSANFLLLLMDLLCYWVNLQLDHHWSGLLLLWIYLFSFSLLDTEILCLCWRRNTNLLFICEKQLGGCPIESSKGICIGIHTNYWWSDVWVLHNFYINNAPWRWAHFLYACPDSILIFWNSA